MNLDDMSKKFDVFEENSDNEDTLHGIQYLCERVSTKTKMR
jgi:hypothetical protein